MQKLSEGCGSGLARQGVIFLVAGLVGMPLACGGLLLMTLIIAPAIARLEPNQQNLALAAVFFVAVFGLIGGALLLWWLSNRGRAARLDAAFTPLGLQGSPYMLNGRHYYGLVQGRALEVYFYRGPTVELRLPAAIQTRVQVVEKSTASPGLQRLFGGSPALALPESWPAWAVFALDAAWTHAWLASPRTEAALRVLMEQGASWALIRQVELLPGEVVLHLYRNRQLLAYPIEAQEVRAWAEALLVLAQAAEGLPAPQVRAALSTHNRAARLKLNRSLNLIILSMVVIFPLCAGSMFLAAILLGK
jgi:hypothetical protein